MKLLETKDSLIIFDKNYAYETVIHSSYCLSCIFKF